MRISGQFISAALFLACGFALADENADYGVAPTRELRLADHAAPTPREVPGARIIRTPQLRAWLQRDASGRPVLLDVVSAEEHDSIPGAIWFPAAGRGSGYDDAVQGQLEKALQVLAYGNRRWPIVFFCASAKCWLSYNAALRAVALGYTEVYWYRGGIEAWLDAGGELSPMSKIKYIM